MTTSRPVHLLHDAEALARMLAIETPCCESVAMPTDGSGAPFAAFLDGNPLAGDWFADLELPTRRLVAWSGSLGETLFEDDPRTWMRPGHDRFAAFCDEVGPALESNGRSLCFRPHHRHVLGDVHATVKFLRERAGQPFEALLSPADLLAPSMLETVEDHLTRMFAHLGPVAKAVLLTDAAIPAQGSDVAADARLSIVPFGSGVLPQPLLASLLREHVPTTTPVILLPGDVERQRTLAGL